MDLTHRRQPPSVFPMYIAIDSSASMRHTIGEVQTAIEDFLVAVRLDPLMADILNIGILSFSDTAGTIVTLTPAAEVASVPTIRVEAGTNYGAAFLLLEDTIRSDLRRLSGSGTSLYRPLVLFMTDGVPTDHHWEEALDRLRSSYNPTFIAFGLSDDADPQVLQTIVGNRGMALYTAPTVTISEAVYDVLRSATTSIGNSVSGAESSARIDFSDSVRPVPSFRDTHDD